MQVLKRYLAREVLGAILLVLAALLMLFAFFDLIREVGDLGRGGYSLPKVLGFVLLSMPGHVYELLPIAALIGTLFALSQLVANSEFTVMRTSGVSVGRVALTLAQTGLVLVCITLLFGELVAPASERAAQQLKLTATSSLVAQEFRSGLWVKDGHSFINVREMLPDTTLLDIRIYDFDQNHRLLSLSEAKRGVYLGKQIWRLEGIVRTQFQDGGATRSALPTMEWPSVLNPDLLGVLLVEPEAMSAWNLFSYIRHLRENQQKTERYEIAMWGKLVYPFATWVMLLLALPFSLIHQRGGGVGAKIFAGIMLGLAFHLFNRVFAHLGFLEAWPTLFSAVAPTLLFLAVAGGLIWWMERR